MPSAHNFDLERFVTAQEPVFDTVMKELTRGRKQSHWMWFVFPQLRGLGRSSMADFYGIASGAEAQAYLAHPILGPRLLHCTEAVLAHTDRSLHAIFGSPDDAKFRSSMTLFAFTGGDPDSAFRRAIELCCAGQPDEQTSLLLRDASGA